MHNLSDPDAHAFDTAAVLIETVHHFDAPMESVFSVLDADNAWSWLPLLGVRYLGPIRRVGMLRDMGTVAPLLRFLWVQRERFTRYEPPQGFSYHVEETTWPLLLCWLEDYQLTPTPDGGCTLRWRVAFTPRWVGRLPLRWSQPLWRGLFRLGLGPAVRRRANSVTEGAVR